MPEHPIEPSEPEQPAPAEQSTRARPSGQPAPDDVAVEPGPSPAPPDAAGASAVDPAGASGAGGAGASGAAAGEAGATEEGADDDADPVAAELEEAVRQRDAHYERLLRVTAEFDNYRKRTERERRELIEQAAGDLLGDLLPVVDDLERALAAETQDGDAYRRGVEIIHKQLLDVMARRGVAPIEAVGADFDPALHQAVVHEPSDGHRDGEVVEELRRGYTLRQRLLRPSMVKVAKA